MAAQQANVSKPSSPTPAAGKTSRIAPRGEPSPEARHAVALLTQLDFSGGPVTPTQAAVWKESLRSLVQMGESAVPAIREFLEKNLDINFNAVEGGKAFGSASLRTALLNAMGEIGGDQAVAGMLQALQTSADPGELALVSAYLQKADATQYREAVLDAAREALTMAASGQWDGRDVAPLFDIMKTFGGAEAAQELEKYANTWFNYTPLILADMPDGAGIPSLIRLAVNADGRVTLGREVYQRMLAQVSMQSPDAANALLQQVQANRIDVNSWQAVADALAGNTLQLSQSPLSQPGATGAVSQKSFHVVVGNQNYVEYPPPADMPADQVNQRIQYIDKLLTITSNPAALTYLQKARATLAARL